MPIRYDIALLQLHRRYFMEALNAQDPLSLRHPYSPSVIATYRGACDVISTVENLLDQEEQLCARFLHFCFNAYFAGASIPPRNFIIKIDISICRGHSPFSLSEDLPVRWQIWHCKTLSECAVWWNQLLRFNLSVPMPWYLSSLLLIFFLGAKFPFQTVLQRHLEKAQRILLSANNVDRFRSNHSVGRSITLPPSFASSHATIIKLAEAIASRSNEFEGDCASQAMTLRPPSPSAMSQDSWLPDIFHFSSAILNPEEKFASKPQMPFTPAIPRVDQNESLNFDYGALFVDSVEENSFMAWFWLISCVIISLFYVSM